MRIRKEWTIAGSLELLAVALANWQALGGIRTDEAKYLLNIPYPHPPLARWIFSLTEAFPFQEMFWRLLLSTLVVQAVWIVWDMTRKFHLAEDRIMVCAGWLLSSAALTQAGAITMAQIMAVQTLAFLWLRTPLEADTGLASAIRRRPALIGLLWTATLFTSYPGALLFPIAWDALRRSGCSWKEMAAYLAGPAVLLALYTMTNPLALAIMLVHRNEGLGTGIAAKSAGFIRLWLVGGSGVASVAGTWGIIAVKRDWPLLFSSLLVFAFVLFSITPWYYSILFAPFFVGGLWKIFHHRRHPGAFPLSVCMIFACGLIVWFVQPSRTPGPARETMLAISGLAPESGEVLISGPFGHEWQYESRNVIRRYRSEFAKDAAAVVCLNPCEPMFDTSGWKRLPGTPVETWVRKRSIDRNTPDTI
ncbi:hypothetical protein HYW84_02555 [Candidatus Peregrinibacteria bacterium]|nr:hypothetical protein [Candidatus Peregrinibacteria bacterium]